MAKILIVDDDVEIQELLTFTLQNEGYEVVVVDNGSMVKDMVYKEKPDLVVLDVMLPGITGYEVLEKLRGDSVTSLIPVIMLTSLSQTKDRITGIKLGADEYLGKPFEPYELVARIEGLLRRVAADMSASISKNDFENEIKRLLKEGESFVLCGLSIDNFGLFNKKFGFVCGDEIISDVYEILQQVLNEFGEKKFNIHKLLGENFVFICKSQKPEVIAKKIREEFDSKNSRYREVGKTKDEKKKSKTPTSSLSISALVVTPGKYTHYLELLEKIKEHSVKV